MVLWFWTKQLPEVKLGKWAYNRWRQKFERPTLAPTQKKTLKGQAKNQQFFEVFQIPRTVIKINGFSNTQNGPFFGKSKNHPKTRFWAGIWFSKIRLFQFFLLFQHQRTMMPVPSKPQKTDGFHSRTEKEPTCFSHISRTVVMKPKIRLITSGSVPVSAYLYTYFLFLPRSL